VNRESSIAEEFLNDLRLTIHHLRRRQLHQKRRPEAFAAALGADLPAVFFHY
jgi:hypothetical protein